MSKLRKVIRALQFSEEWRETLEAACILEGVENTQDLQVVVTNALADQIDFNEDTLEIDVTGVEDGDVLQAVDAYQPPEDTGTPETATPLNAQLEAAITGFTASLLEDTGRGMSEPWQQPTGAHDAYPKGWVSSHEGKVWESLVPFNVWAPGVSGWREIPSKGNIPNWQQPSGVHDAYKQGDQVTHKDSVWTSNIDGNVWEPGTGDLWLDLGPML